MRRDGADSPPDRTSSAQRFRPDQRLRRRRDFDAVFSGGIRLSAQVVTIIARANGTDRSRLGLSVSRRAARSAVARNRLKRHIRESFRHNAARLTGLDVVVIPKSGAQTMDTKRLRGLLARTWERARTRLGRARPGTPQQRGA